MLQKSLVKSFHPIDLTLISLFVLIMAYLPFHALLSTWLWTNLGYEVWFKAGKEVVLTAAMVLLLVRLIQVPKLAKQLFARKINQVIIVFAVLHLVTAVVFRPELDALTAGLILNGRFLAMFVLAQYIMLVFGPNFRSTLVRLVLGQAYIVAVIAVLQAFVLPADAMKFFGYGPDSIPAQFSIDSNQDLRRVSSTLRGPNPLGAYLIAPIIMLVVLITEKWRFSQIFWLTLLTFGLVLSYSRSATLGLVAALVGLFIWKIPVQYKKNAILALGVMSAIALLLAPAAVNNSNFLRRVVLHDDGGVDYATSTQVHLDRQLEAVDQALQRPLGGGPGSAGPASFYLDEGGIISENYYLQLSLEVGVAGLLLFGVIVYYVGRDLWRQRSDKVALALFLSLLGLSVANLFLHVWADETTAMIWWGLAGLWFASGKKSVMPKSKA